MPHPDHVEPEQHPLKRFALPLAALAAALVAWLGVVFNNLEDATPQALFTAFGFYVVFGWFVALVIGVLLGWPGVRLLRRLGARGVLAHLALGLAIALLVWLGFALFTHGFAESRPLSEWLTNSDNRTMLTMATSASLAGAAVYWALARPDRDSP